LKEAIVASLPGWDDLESVSRWVTFWEIAMIIILAALVGAEVLHFKYSHRMNDLIGLRDHQLEEQAKRAGDEAETRRKVEVEALQRKLEEAGQQVAALQEKQADRHLSDEQTRIIFEAIAPFPGQRVDLVTVMGNGEALRYAQDFLEVFKKAKWVVNGDMVAQASYTGTDADVVGIVVSISQANGMAHRAPMGAGILMQTMIRLGLIKEGFNHPDVRGDDVQVLVGRKPANP
jgi:hypothetical protein